MSVTYYKQFQNMLRNIEFRKFDCHKVIVMLKFTFFLHNVPFFKHV